MIPEGRVRRSVLILSSSILSPATPVVKDSGRRHALYASEKQEGFRVELRVVMIISALNLLEQQRDSYVMTNIIIL